MLIRSDGQAIGIGCNQFGQITIPELPHGVTYVQAAAGKFHTVLLRSDGRAVAFGRDTAGETNLPTLEDGVTFVAQASLCPLCTVVQVHIHISAAGEMVSTCTNGVTGVLLAQNIIEDLSAPVRHSVQRMIKLPCHKLCVVVPDGRLAGSSLTWMELKRQVSAAASGGAVDGLGVNAGPGLGVNEGPGPGQDSGETAAGLDLDFAKHALGV